MQSSIREFIFIDIIFWQNMYIINKFVCALDGKYNCTIVYYKININITF